MIVTIASQHGGAGRAVLASQLALLRARAGRR
jgi:Mrp family chromosome partitioning ATPase